MGLLKKPKPEHQPTLAFDWSPCQWCGTTGLIALKFEPASNSMMRVTEWGKCWQCEGLGWEPVLRLTGDRDG